MEICDEGLGNWHIEDCRWLAVRVKTTRDRTNDVRRIIGSGNSFPRTLNNLFLNNVKVESFVKCRKNTLCNQMHQKWGDN